MNSVSQSNMAIVLRRLLNEQSCSECPLRKACDVYEQQSISGSSSICNLLSEQAKTE